jgi:hypothetical protein
MREGQRSMRKVILCMREKIFEEREWRTKRDEKKTRVRG